MANTGKSGMAKVHLEYLNEVWIKAQDEDLKDHHIREIISVATEVAKANSEYQCLRECMRACLEPILASHRAYTPGPSEVVTPEGYRYMIGPGETCWVTEAQLASNRRIAAGDGNSVTDCHGLAECFLTLPEFSEKVSQGNHRYYFVVQYGFDYPTEEAESYEFLQLEKPGIFRAQSVKGGEHKRFYMSRFLKAGLG